MIIFLILNPKLNFKLENFIYPQFLMLILVYKYFNERIKNVFTYLLIIILLPSFLIYLLDVFFPITPIISNIISPYYI